MNGAEFYPSDINSRKNCAKKQFRVNKHKS